MEKSTNELASILAGTAPDKVDNYFKNNRGELFGSEKPFATYMRTMIKAKGLLQQEVFAKADISEGYGYKIISEEKHTKQRDVIIRLCLGAHFSLEETQRALKIYGMSPLYPRISRDAVLTVALSSQMFDVDEVNTLLKQNNESPLQPTDSYADT